MSLMTEERNDHVHNITLPSGAQGREYRSGTGKVIATGDMIRVDGKEAMYRVIDIRVEWSQVYITAYGGKKGQLLTRTFHVDRCSRARKGEDNNEGYREAVSEAAAASKRGKRGWTS